MNANWKNKVVSGCLGLALLLVISCNRGNDNKESHAPANPNIAGHEGHEHTTKTRSAEEETYTCPMHPQIVQDKPGSCPICGMDLVKKNNNVGDSVTVDADLKALLQPTNSVVVANIATLHPELRSEPVQVQANGIVTYDTRRLYTIPARFGGRIEKVYVRFNYQPIRKGQKLLELYSPDIITAQRELIYLLDADAGNAPLIASAKQKLRLLGVTEEQLTNLIRTRKTSYSLAIYSPYDGYVIEETAAPPSVRSGGPAAPATGGMVTGSSPSGMGGGGMTGGGTAASTDEITFPGPTPPASNNAIGGALLLREGQYVQTGQTLYRIVNPSRLWAEFRLYARDAAGIKTGDALTLSFDQTSQASRQARVSFVIPFVENGNPFVTVRAYLPGATDIRVGQLARATIRREVTEGIWLPATAVLDLGNEQVVFVQQDQPGVFKPIRVQVGSQSGNNVAIRSGLTTAQVVAQNAQFLSDSESFVNVARATQ